jgi:hypothetical protein
MKWERSTKWEGSMKPQPSAGSTSGPCSRASGQSSLEYLICLALMLGAVAITLDDPWSQVVTALHDRFERFSFRLGQP